MSTPDAEDRRAAVEYDYRCVNGHDLCHGGANAGPSCPTCERRRVPTRPWRLYDVTVTGYGSTVMTGPSAAAVRVEAWRHDVFGHIDFVAFMRRCRARLRKEPLSDDGYGYVRRAYGVDPKIGQRVELRNEGRQNGREGCVIYPGHSTASVRVILDGDEHPVIVHPHNVVLLPTPDRRDPGREDEHG